MRGHEGEVMYTATVVTAEGHLTRADTYEQCEAWVEWLRSLGTCLSGKIEPEER